MWSMFIAIMIAAASTAAGSIKIVKQGEEALVEFLGRYDGRKLEPGLSFTIPFLSTVACRETIREQVLAIPAQNCITRDNVSITVDAVIYWRILDLEKAYYKVQNLNSAMSNLVQTQIRSEMGKLELNETFTARTEVNETLLRELDVATEPWGVKITRVELRDIVPSKTVQGAMELQMSAERKKQAAILTSEGERDAAINSAKGEAEAQLIEAEARKKASILKAEAEREQQILKAKATAEAIDIISDRLQHNPLAAEALQFLTTQTYLEMGMKIGMSDSSKVMFFDPRTVPSNFSATEPIAYDVSHPSKERSFSTIH